MAFAVRLGAEGIEAFFTPDLACADLAGDHRGGQPQTVRSPACCASDGIRAPGAVHSGTISGCAGLGARR
jgi:hypothetical protein